MNDREIRLQSIVLQILDHLTDKDEQFMDCEKCNGTGDGDSWIPTCQTCYGVGRVINFKNK